MSLKVAATLVIAAVLFLVGLLVLTSDSMAATVTKSPADVGIAFAYSVNRSHAYEKLIGLVGCNRTHVNRYDCFYIGVAKGKVNCARFDIADNVSKHQFNVIKAGTIKSTVCGLPATSGGKSGAPSA